MNDGRARRLLALVASSMTNEAHRTARLTLMKTEWTDPTAADEALDRLARLTGMPKDTWARALIEDMRGRKTA
jgi:hypothetical protein